MSPRNKKSLSEIFVGLGKLWCCRGRLYHNFNSLWWLQFQYIHSVLINTSIAIDWIGFLGTRLRCNQTLPICHLCSSESINWNIPSYKCRSCPTETSDCSLLLYEFKAIQPTNLSFIMESITDEQMLASFRTLDKKFRRSCHHIRMLNRHIEDIQIRYDRAFASGRRSFRYTHRLKLATYEGMRNMYYEYACRRADELEKMQDCLIQRGMISESDSDSDADMEYWSIS